MTDQAKTKKAFVIKDFRDSGTEQTFTASTAGNAETMPEIEQGAFTNYEHAGLVHEPTEDDLTGRNLPTTPVI